MAKSFKGLRSRPKPQYRALYGRKWKTERALFLGYNPWCKSCFGRGTMELAKVVDHIKPHRGDKKLFWDRKNWQSLCTLCHDIKTLTGNSERGFAPDGSPLDPSNPWSRNYDARRTPHAHSREASPASQGDEDEAEH